MEEKRHRLLHSQQRLNRALNVLSMVSQTVDWAQDERELLNEACRILVESGGYRLAWVGFTDQDAEKGVRPVAWAGLGSDYVRTVDANWADRERGGGRTGRAIRSGRPAVVRNVLSDPDYPSWRREAHRHGFSSSVALPLLINGQAIGALAVYAAEPSAFDDEELHLLQELVDDLAYGIQTLRAKKALRYSEAPFSKAFRASPIGVLITSKRTERIIDVNRSALQLFGYSHHEVIGRTSEELSLWVTTEPFQDVGEVLEEGSGSRELELKVRTKDATIRHVTASFQRILLEDEPCVLALIHDVTGRHQVEERLRRYNDRLVVLREIEQAILAAQSPDSIVEVALSRLQRLIPYQRASVTLFDFAREQASTLAVVGDGQVQIPKGHRFDLQDFRGVEELTQGRVLLVPDLASQSRPSPIEKELLKVGTRSVLKVPLLSQEGLTGALNLGAAQVAFFTDEHAEIAIEVAGSLAVALQNAQLFQETKRQTRRLSALYETALIVSGTLDMDDLLARLTRQLQQLLAPDTLFVALYDVEAEMVDVVLAMEEGKPVPGAKEIRLPLAEAGLSGWVIRKQKPLLIQDMEEDEVPAQPRHETRPAVSWLGVPLRIQDRVTGILSVQSFQPHAFGEADRRLLQSMAAQVAIAIQNAELFAETQRLLQRTKEQARQVQQIVDTVPEAMLLLDSDRRIQLMNPAAVADLQAVTSAQLGDVLDHLAQEPIDRFLGSAGEGASWHELRLFESERTFEIASQPIEVGVEMGGWVLVLREVTEERERQERLQMQERLATVGQLAAGIAHDFNNIMATITLYSETLEYNPEHKKRAHYLRTIGKQAHHASSLITQILDFSRRSVMTRSELELRPLLEEVVRLLQRTLPESIDISFEAETEEEYWVSADPTRLQQALVNLALNARDAMPHGGTLHFSLGRLHLDDGDHPPVPDMGPGHWIRLQVADSGKGMTPEVLSHLYEPFYTTKPPGQGTGLGLAQVYGIVKQHRGDVAVDSAVGQGTTFTIFLPATLSPATSPEGSSRSAAAESGQGQLILLVEDNEVTREAMTDVLKSLEYRVLDAGNGQEALALFREHAREVALVLSDMVMPSMGGTELLERMVEMDPRIKVVMMTGYPLEDSDQELLRQGVVGWVQKPFDIDELQKVVQEALA